MTPLVDSLLDIADRLSDEGDRVYLGSTNDADRLREIARTLEALTVADAARQGVTATGPSCVPGGNNDL